MRRFKLKKITKSGVRLGEVLTRHGKIQTPFFMPDATRGYLKTLSNSDLDKAGVGQMVVNTYHLYLQPGMEKIKKAGGIHKFMDWSKPLLSDSGGFQVFSLIHRNANTRLTGGQVGKITDDKVIFRSPIDGSWHEITPEKSIQIQFDLGVDMMVCLDDCPPNSYSKEKLEAAVDRTISWAERCWIEYWKQIKKRKIKDKDRPLIFCVIQGGADLALRKKCVEALMEIGFSALLGPASGWDGYGFGAMPVDAEGKFLEDVLKFTADIIPKDALRFALGIGNPGDIIRCASYGWDMFDCVIPTREGRHGRILEVRGQKLDVRKYKSINITNSKYSKDFNPINKFSNIAELKKYSKAYLYHLFKMKETLGQRLASLNNLESYFDLMKKIRQEK